MSKPKYVERADYIPEEIRKKYKVGEYAEDEKEGDEKERDKEKQ